MKSLYLTTIILIASTINVAGQDWKIEFLSDSVTVSEHNLTYIFNIDFSVQKLKNDPPSSVFRIHTLYNLGADEGKDFKLVSKDFELISAKFDSGEVNKQVLQIEIIADTLSEKLESAIIGFDFQKSNSITSESTSFILIIESEEPEFTFNPNQPFRIAIGTNFDLINSTDIKTNDLYSEINFSQKKLLVTKRKHILGLIGGYYQTKTISSDDEKLNIRFANSNYISIAQELSGDSVQVNFNSIRGTVTENFDNLGLYVIPTIKWVDREINQNEYFSLHVGMHMEVVKRKRLLSFNNESVVLDSAILSNQQLISALQDSFPKPQLALNETNDVGYDRFYGISVPFYYHNKNTEFHITPSLGFGSFAFHFNPNSKTLFDLDNAYYIINFKIIEKTLGLQLSGDFRGFFKSDDKNLLAISLSKLFNLEKLLSFQ